MDCEGLKAMNDLDYDPFAAIDLMKMEEEVRSDQVMPYSHGRKSALKKLLAGPF